MQYSQETQGVDSYLIPFIQSWLTKRRFKRTIAICEFGGGAGQLLGVLQKEYPRASYTDAEITPEYRNSLVSKKISFQLQSVLDSTYPDRSFDVLIIRDVLHHLVGRNYQETVQNQRMALLELRRLVAPGGAIFIEELTSSASLASRLVYEIANLNSRIGIRISAISLNPNIIVSFMTPKSLIESCRSIFGARNITKKIIPLPMRCVDRVTYLGGQTAKVILIITP